MEIDSRTGLVLEGGGMRAIFTVGVLDCFMTMTFGSLIRSVCLPGRATVFRMPPGTRAFPFQQYRPAGEV